MTFDVDDDGVATYRTVDGDVLDLIAFNFYGDHERTTELVLEFNPGLADLGPVYAAGSTIRLPYRAESDPVPAAQIELWT